MSTVLAFPADTPERLRALLHAALPRAAGGDHAAYAEVVRASQSTVASIAMAITRDHASSEDIAQEAFLRAWQRLPELRSPDSFLPWLRQITRNLARDHLRAQRLRQAPPGLDVDAALAAAADPAPGPAGRAAADEEAAVAADVLDALPEEAREVLLLFYREGQSSRQVASLLGLSDAAVRKRLQRARDAVREGLLARLGEFARASAPGAAFTAAVAAGALSLGAPGAASAAMLAGGAGMGAGASAGSGVGKGLLALLGPAAIGVGGGLLGTWLGHRRAMRDALDDAERRATTRATRAIALATVAFGVGFPWLLLATRGWLWAALLGAGFFATMAWQAGVAMGRVRARRHAALLARDGEAARPRITRERRVAALGLWLGMAMGLAGLVAGIVLTGRPML